LVFTDDDCYPAQDFLTQALEAFRDPAVGYVGGRTLLFDTTDSPVAIRVDETHHRLEPRTYVPAGLIPGACFAIRRSVAREIGYFDPDLGAGTAFSCEDVDIVARASAAGWAGVYFPPMFVYHHHGRKHSQASALRRHYDYGRGAYHMKLLLDGPLRPLYFTHICNNWLHIRPMSVSREICGMGRYLRHRVRKLLDSPLELRSE